MRCEVSDRLRVGGGSLLPLFLSLAIFLFLSPQSSLSYPPMSSSSSNSGLKGSQQYLQDPWNHEHNYFQKVNVGPHKHGWGWGPTKVSHPAHGDAVDFPEQATYIQRLYPIFSFSNNLKKLSSTIKALKPGKHSWSSFPAVALFGSDGKPHHLQVSKEPHYEGGWSYNHMSHHTGHKLPEKTHYNTW